LLADGLFTKPTYANDGWLEDPTFYRDGAILLGVVSHEDEGFLNISTNELADLERLGFTLYPPATHAHLYKQPSNER